jgi:tetratricopeptide (TPR) repeat protein
MKLRMQSILVAATIVCVAVPAFAADSEWVGKMAIVKTRALKLIVVDKDGNESEGPDLKSICFKVLEQKDGRIKVEHRSGFGWIEYADIVMLDEAVPYLTERILQEPTAEAYQTRAAAHILNKDYDKALDDLDKTDHCRGWPHWSVCAARSYACIGKKDWPNAIAHSKSAVDLDPQDANFLAQHAHLLLTCPDQKLRDAKLALAFANKAMAIDKDHAWAVRVAGAAHQELGDLDEARRLYEEYLRLSGTLRKE